MDSLNFLYGVFVTFDFGNKRIDNNMKKIVIVTFLMFLYGLVVAQTYHIGDLYTAQDGSQGIVFFITPEGDGWVVALNDASSGCQWGSETDVPGLVNRHDREYQQMLKDTTGYENTRKIRNFLDNGNYAARVVDFDNGWILPSTAQLSMLYGQLPFISSAITNAGGTLPEEQSYWSSVECSPTRAWIVSLSSGGCIAYSKTESYRVRAIRVFSNPSIQYSWNTGATTPNIWVSPSETTTYTITVTANNQSNSISQTVVVACRDTVFMEESVCDYYVWGEDTLTHTGDYRHVFQNSSGMDSIVTLRLRVLSSPKVVIQSEMDSICEGTNVGLQTSLNPLEIESFVSVGDILCTDNTTVKPSEWPVEGKTALGVVFYVDYSGKHGWAVNLQQSSYDISWGVVGVDVPLLVNIDDARLANRDTNGLANTQKIRMYGDAESYPAAWSVDLENGWYLPAAGQVCLMAAEWVTLNSTLQLIDGSALFPMNNSASYWSSTEFGCATAWEVSGIGDIGNPSKNVNGFVRGIRDF